MKGLELSEKYYVEYGVPMLREQFPGYEERIAVGLVGRGSECYGFDDDISTDHDFGPSFCMWLTDEDYEKIGEMLIKAYRGLPQSYMGYKRSVSAHGEGRAGVFRIGDFYRSFIGNPTGSLELNEWMYMPEHFLSEVTNGKVFRDTIGEFSEIRSRLLGYYPDDVRIKKIAARAAVMAQSGQYNYGRSMRRHEQVAARLALDEFIRSTISMAYLLNRAYQPFYKWAHRGMDNFKTLPEIRSMLDELSWLPVQSDAWGESCGSWLKQGINMRDRAVELVELICALVVQELLSQGLTVHSDSFLENHTACIMSKIKNDKIRAMHVMRG